MLSLAAVTRVSYLPSEVPGLVQDSPWGSIGAVVDANRVMVTFRQTASTVNYPETKSMSCAHRSKVSSKCGFGRADASRFVTSAQTQALGCAKLDGPARNTTAPPSGQACSTCRTLWRVRTGTRTARGYNDTLDDIEEHLLSRIDIAAIRERYEARFPVNVCTERVFVADIGRRVARGFQFAKFACRQRLKESVNRRSRKLAQTGTSRKFTGYSCIRRAYITARECAIAGNMDFDRRITKRRWHKIFENDIVVANRRLAF